MQHGSCFGGFQIVHTYIVLRSQAVLIQPAWFVLRLPPNRVCLYCFALSRGSRTPWFVLRPPPLRRPQIVCICTPLQLGFKFRRPQISCTSMSLRSRAVLVQFGLVVRRPQIVCACIVLRSQALLSRFGFARGRLPNRVHLYCSARSGFPPTYYLSLPLFSLFSVLD